MSRIFLSHSSKDVRQAIALKQWLVGQNPPLANEIFLDVDPETGLRAGTRWKDALRQANARCEAVICLLSPNWEASHECKVEYRTAENLNKQIFIARLAESAGDDMTGEWQRSDLFGTGAMTSVAIDFGPPVQLSTAGLYRLRDGILGAGIGAEAFVWPPPGDPGRAPYRGWAPLEEADAAVFFGRDAEILRALDALRGLRRSEVNSLFVVLGPSGTGKSSFLRAGLLPRLRREDRRFVVCDIVRPERNALIGESGLAQAIVGTRRAFGMTVPSLGDVKAACLAGDADRIADWLNDVRARAAETLVDRGEDVQTPTLVLPLDQAEELFSADAGENAEIFLRLLAAVVRRCNAEEVGLLVAATIRTDRYEVMQTHPALAGMGSVLFDELKPMPATQFKEVITGPAQRASEGVAALRISPDLVDRLLADAGQGADALPMLALTLSRLYNDYGSTGELTVAQYETLGGIRRVVQTEIDEVLASDPARRSAQLAALRAAFIPWLATVNPDNDQPMRRVARFADLPEESRPLIEALVSKRLMVKDIRDGQAVVEVALESLLRQWDELAGWLREERKSLKDADDLERAAASWALNDRDSAWLLSGTRLTEAETLSGAIGFRQRLTAATDYLAASRRAENERQAEIEGQRQAEIRNALERQATAEAHAATLRKRSRVLRAVLALTAVVAVVAVLGLVSANRASTQADNRFRQATSVRLTAEATGIWDGDRPGSDVQAIQQMLAARALTPTPDDEALYSAAVKDTNTKKIIETADLVWDVSHSPDGTRLAVAGVAGVRIYDAVTGQPVTDPLPGIDGATIDADFSPDGRLLATGGQDDTVRVWNTDDGSLAQEFPGHSDTVKAVRFSPDGYRLASSGIDRTLMIWDVDSGRREVNVPTGHAEVVNAIAYSPDGKRVATGSDDDEVRFLSAQTGALQGEPLAPNIGSVNDVAFSSGGDQLAIAGVDVALWDVAAAPTERYRLGNGVDTVSSVSYSPDGRRLAVGSSNGSVGIWDPRDGNSVGLPITGHEGTVFSVDYSPDGARLATGSRDRTARIWDPEAGQPLFGHTDSVRGVSYSPDGRLLASVSSDATLRFWSADTGLPVGAPVLAGAPLECLAFSPDGRLVAVGGANGVIEIWNVVSRQRVTVVDTGTPATIRSIQFKPDGSRLSVLDWNGNAGAWRPDTGAVVGAVFPNVRGIRLDAAWSLIAFSLMDGNGLYLTRLDGSENDPAPMEGHTNAVRVLRFGPDDRLLASGGDDNSIRFWDTETRRPVGEPLRGHSHSVTDLAFSPDGARLISGSADATVRMWVTDTHRQFGSALLGHSERVNGVSFRPDGTSFASSSNDWTVRIWPATATPKDLCDKLTANMSHRQWDEWVSPDIDYVPACPGLPVAPD